MPLPHDTFDAASLAAIALGERLAALAKQYKDGDGTVARNAKHAVLEDIQQVAALAGEAFQGLQEGDALMEKVRVDWKRRGRR